MSSHQLGRHVSALTGCNGQQFPYALFLCSHCGIVRLNSGPKLCSITSLAHTECEWHCALTTLELYLIEETLRTEQSRRNTPTYVTSVHRLTLLKTHCTVWEWCSNCLSNTCEGCYPIHLWVYLPSLSPSSLWAHHYVSPLTPAGR